VIIKLLSCKSEVETSSHEHHSILYAGSSTKKYIFTNNQRQLEPSPFATGVPSMVSFAVAAYARARVCFYENTTLSNFGFQLVQVKSLTHEQHCYTSQLRRLF